MRKGLRYLEPVDEAGIEGVRKIKTGDVVRVEITRPRNIHHHRKFWSLLTTVWQATDQWPSAEDLLIELKVRLGVTRDVVILQTGEVVKVVGSISFAKMDQAAFEKFYDQALRELCDMAGGIEQEALRGAVLDQLGAA